MGAISARAARWCSQKRDHLTFFHQRAPGRMERAGREVNKSVTKKGVHIDPPVPMQDLCLLYFHIVVLY